MRTTLFALSLCLPVASGLAARVALADPTPASIWKTDFAAAEAEAKRLNRPLVVHFHAAWCGPCKKMEKEALHSAQAIQMLDAGFVAVKVDWDKNPKLARKFAVKNLPTDLIVGPDGKILVRNEGYDEGGQHKYLANLTHVSTRFAAEAQRVARANAAPDNKSNTAQREAQPPQPPIIKDRELAATAPASKDKLPPPANRVDPPAGLQSDDPTKLDRQVQDAPAEIEFEEILVAMDGYCPVTLRTTRTWTTGNKAISLEYEGQIFYFTATDKRDEFKAHPGRYAPRLLGCDPVTLAENDVAVRGSTQFGAFYDGALFLFESADSRTKFRKAPTRYSQLKHVIKLEDVKKVASNSDP
jgi:thiol-disulfide isomerase/thioredoxin/YHS domain-containing protein